MHNLLLPTPEKTFQIHINGKSYAAHAGQTVAAALACHVEGQTRCSPTGQARAPVCGMGVCQECRVSINGQPHQLACQTYCQDGMQIANHASDQWQTIAAPVGRGVPAVKAATQAKPSITVDLAVIGAGPAGQAAAVAAARHGKRVALIDDNPLPGGQIWRAAALQSAAPTAALDSWQQVLAQPNIQWFAASKLVQVEGQQLRLQTAQEQHSIHFQQLILATGARERLLPFPGWTLPCVTGLGGLQALAKGGYPVQGKRVVLAGTGPLLLAVAASLRKAGAQVVRVLEQTSASKLIGFGLGLWQTPSKLLQATGLGWQLAGIGYQTSSYICAAFADADGKQLAGVRLRHANGEEEEIACDYLACGYGLLPNTRLAQSLGCAIHTAQGQDAAVQVNLQQQTSVPGIWCVGEACGIGGVDKARLEGEIAGLDACGISSAHLQAAHRRWLKFSASLQTAFSLRPETLQLATPETIICRCEDVSLAQILRQPDWRSAKLQTRCGMGACQGLICASALENLFPSAEQSWQFTGLREPLAPTKLAQLVDHLVS